MDFARWTFVVCLLFSTTGSEVDSQMASSPVFQQKPRNVTEKLYETVYFSCQAIGFPTPTIKWVKYSSGNQETVIETSGRFVINRNGYLYILGVEWSDSGRYACIAQNTHGRIIAYANLNVVTESAPSWHVKPHNVTLYKGQMYTLPCKTYGYPEPYYKWLKDNYPIWDIDLAPHGKELTFLVARTWHSGKYTCTAFNIKGSISESVYVNVVPDPSIIIQPENVSAYHGEAITLSCGVVSNNEQLSVSWTRYGKNVSDRDKLISFTQQTWNNERIYSLKISKVRKRHLGKYHCIVTNSKGTVTSNKAFISHTNSVVPLQIEVPKSEVITTEGADIELMCVFVGSPSPQITWYKDGKKLANNDSQVTVTLNSRCEAFLKLKSVTLLDAGKYGCEGGNLAGNVRGNITLFVKGENVKAINAFQEAKRDSVVKLQCIIMTPVFPDVAWYKDGQLLEIAKTSLKQQSNGLYSAELEIRSAQYSDTGFYTCMVQNLFGINSGNVTLKVKGSPEAPTNVTVKPQSLQTIQVTWVPGYDGGAHTIFTVQFKRRDSNSWTSTDAVNSNVTSTVLSKSEGWDGLFVFRVTAVNQFGSTESSEVSVVLRGKTDNPQQRTDQASPTGAIVGGVIGGLLLIVLIIVVVLFLRRMKKKRKAPSRPSPAVMYTVVNSENNKRNGMYDEATGIPRGRQDTYSYVSIRPDAASAMAMGVGGEYASIPRPKQWEVPKRNVRLDKALGSGHFGKVMKGFLKTRQGTQIVAVKMLKENADQQQKKEFLDELELMKTIAPHPNIVGLVGCCTKSAQPFIIVEFCSMGNLRDFLRSSHGTVVYANMAGNSLTLTCRDLLSFAWQCARGMSYLASQKVVHRDLAARNILVDKGHVCKIADFGLARDIYEKKQYLKLGEADLPLRWMAIESIFQGVTTTESDVWSFGILLWEIVTLGAHPYPALGRDQLIEELRSGYRMPKPKFCSDELYAIMWQCWQQDPASRPTFLELGKTLHRLMTAQTLSIDLDNYDRSYINATKELEL